MKKIRRTLILTMTVFALVGIETASRASFIFKPEEVITGVGYVRGGDIGMIPLKQASDDGDIFFEICDTSNDIIGGSEIYMASNELGCKDATPVSEPTTMLLVGTGLLVIVGFRKKFKK